LGGEDEVGVVWFLSVFGFGCFGGILVLAWTVQMDCQEA